jgi:tetratricopeptide (TPR) repeat protein
MRLRILATSLAAIILLGETAHADEVVVEHGVGAGRDVQVGGDINIGLTPVQVRDLMQQILGEQNTSVAKVEELSGRLGVTNSAIETFFQILGQQNVPIEDLPATLVEIAQRHRSLIEQIGSVPSQSPDIQAIKDRARDAVEQGDYERAEALLTEAEDRALEAARRVRAEADRQFLDAAATRAERGELSLTQLDYAGAASHFRSAAELVPATSPLVRADYLNRCGGAAQDAGHYTTAQIALEEALSIRERRLQHDHFSVGQSLNNLALLYEIQGRYHEAEPLYNRAIQIIETALGPNHPTLGTTFNNLALLNHARGRYDDAEPLYQRALKIRETALGPDHPDVGTSLNNLAELYRNQGRYDDAEPLYQRAIRVTESALGLNHPLVATSVNNLAELYREQGRHDDAESLQERALAIREIALGPSHPDVGASLNNLALLYQAQGRYEEAVALYERMLEILKRALPPDHPYSMLGAQNYARLLRQLGREAEAAEWEAKAVAIRAARERADTVD